MLSSSTLSSVVALPSHPLPLLSIAIISLLSIHYSLDSVYILLYPVYLSMLYPFFSFLSILDRLISIFVLLLLTDSILYILYVAISRVVR